MPVVALRVSQEHKSLYVHRGIWYILLISAKGLIGKPTVYLFVYRHPVDVPNTKPELVAALKFRWKHFYQVCLFVSVEFTHICSVGLKYFWTECEIFWFHPHFPKFCDTFVTFGTAWLPLSPSASLQDVCCAPNSMYCMYVCICTLYIYVYIYTVYYPCVLARCALRPVVCS